MIKKHGTYGRTLLFELDKSYPSKYDVLFYNLKLYLEWIHEIKTRNLSNFEKMRIKSMNDPFLVLSDDYCNKCNHYTSVITELISYCRLFANANSDDRVNHMNTKCYNKECKNGFLEL